MTGETLTRQPPRVVGRYAVCDAIAAGGMATVHLGRLLGPVGFSRTVAIKRLHPQFARNEEFVGMFLDEARLVARIRHPNVIPTLDVVSTPGELFLVMDYVPGESLSKLLRGAMTLGRRLPPRVVASILAATLHGLHAAHEARDEHGQPLGIVHRDVSPQNVLVGADGVPRILDFGVAKAAGRVQTTQAGQLKGKLAYMAPEQIRADVVNRQTDVYAASIVLWESLTGQRLYDASNEGALMTMVMDAKCVPPSTVVLAQPGPLDDEARQDLGRLDGIVMRGLAKDPAHRFASARDMALALESTVRPATAAEIAAWVEASAAAGLAKRAQMVASIERDESLLRLAPLAEASASGQSFPPAAHSHSALSSIPPPGMGTEISNISGASQLSGVAFASVSTAPLPPTPSKRTPVLVVAGSTMFGITLAIAILGMLHTFGGSTHRPTNGGRALPAEPSGLSSPSTASAASDTPPPAESEWPASSSSAVELAAATGDAGLAVAPETPAPDPNVHHTHHRTPTAPADPCSPPFTLDASGIRHYKPQCI